MLRRIYIIGVLLFAFSVLDTNSQSLIDVRHYSLKDGLSQRNIHNFVQDDNGYIWMSTRNGLEQFDGFTFRNFKTYPGDSIRIPNHRFLRIEKSTRNNIWCLTYDNHCYLFNISKTQFEDPFSYNKSYTNSAQKIYPLKDGITWIVDTQNKLYRIDENKFPMGESIVLHHTINNRQTINNVYDIVQDTDGDEWILTNAGCLIVGDKSINTSIPFSFMAENDGTIYLATSEGLFARYEKGTHKMYPYPSLQITNSIVAMKALADGRIALLEENSLILYYPTEERFEYHSLPIAVSNLVYQDSSKNIWLVGTSENILLLRNNGDKIEMLTCPRAQKKSEPVIHEDDYGTVWIKPQWGELCYYNTLLHRLEQAFIYKDGIRENVSIRPLNYLVDHHQNIWYTDGEICGYISFAENNLHYLKNSYQTAVRALMEDGKKRLWVGWQRNSQNKTGYLCIYDSLGQWTANVSMTGKIIHDSAIPFNANVYCLYEDKQHNIWIGTKGLGLYLLRPKGDGHYTLSHYLPNKNNPYSLSSENIYSILQDSAGRIWIGTFGGGINIVEELPVDRMVKFFNSRNTLKNLPKHNCDKIRCLLQAKDGTLFIGTTDGLLSCNPNLRKLETIQFYRDICEDRSSSLSNNDVLDITEAQDGRLWITTLNGGINLLNASNRQLGRLEFIHYNKKNSDVSDYSLSTIEDKSGNLWIVSEKKLSKFDSDMNLLEEYDNRIQYLEGNPTLNGSDRIAFCSKFGAVIINSAINKDGSFIPPISFSSLEIYINGELYKKVIPHQNGHLSLEAEQRNFTVKFTALDYTNPHNIKYAYRIPQLNEQWIELGTTHSVNIANLPAGNYEFQVRSTNAEGIWAENNTSLYIEIAPYFSETIWAKLLYAIIGICILLLTIYIVTRITGLQRKLDMEKYITELKLRFFTDISHELRTPLTLITGPIDEVLVNEKLSSEGKENMLSAKRNTERMLRLVNQILDFRKIQNNKMKVLIEQVDIVPIIRRVYDSFHTIADKHNINFLLECPAELFIMYTDVDKLEKILFNLISNAFKYTPDGKNILLSFSFKKSKLLFQIKDEGYGISPQKLKTLFNRFEAHNTANPSNSTGIGLFLVKGLLELLHGTIEVASKVGEGTTFFVHLPGNYEAYKSDKNVEFILNDIIDDELSLDIESNKQEAIENKKSQILIIEDNDELRHFVKNIMSNDFVVLEAENGKIGWDTTLKEMPDIVISDIMMPEMNGVEYLKLVKENNQTCHIPIILLSAKSSLEEQIQGLRYGADDYITKPFSSSYLKSKVEALLRRRNTLYNYYISKREKQKSSLSDTPEIMLQITDFDADFLNKVMHYIEENIQNSDLKIENIADFFCMSRSVFYRKLKSLMGVSPVDLIKNIRIKRSMQLLKETEYTVSEIAYLSGFATPQYFNRVFKETVKCTPSEFRMQKD